LTGRLTAVGSLGLVLALFSQGSWAGRPRPSVRPFDLEHARSFAEFPLYDAGDRVDGLALNAVLRRDDTADFVSFVYGDCVARDDQGCAPPLEIQVWPACKRNLGLYTPSGPGMPVPERTTVRGVPAAFFEDDRLELQTGSSTVVVFAGSRARLLHVAAALRPLGAGRTSTPLPAPEAGAVAGTVRC
jgi:hypothetical protein